MSVPPPQSEPTVAQRVARNLVRLRHDAGLTQQQLADAARVSRATVHLIESAQADPRLSTLDLLARALNVDPSTLTSC
jgi:transcriptional regulator with XRE-family HTH domain